MNNLMIVIGVYLTGVVLCYIISAGTDYIRYLRNGYTDTKFPITSFTTHKVIAVLSLIWFVLVFVSIYDALYNWSNRR